MGNMLHFQLESEKAAFLIGKRGQTLNALQQLSQLVANKSTESIQSCPGRCRRLP